MGEGNGAADPDADDRDHLVALFFSPAESGSVAAAALGSPEPALAAYPQHIPLAARLEQYLAAISGQQRRSLAVTALAGV